MQNKTIIRYLFFIAFSIVLQSCATQKKYYGIYSVNTFGYDSANNINLRIFTHIISFGEYLFEYKLAKHNGKVFKGDELVSDETKYDTTGVYILAAQNKRYYEFDTFALNASLKTQGAIENKKQGTIITFANKADVLKTRYGPVTQKLVNNVTSYVAEVMPTEISPIDTFKMEFTLVKNKQLNSLYKFSGIEFIDKNYCIVGTNMYNLIEKESVQTSINNLRQLTKAEEAICTSMLKKAGL